MTPNTTDLCPTSQPSRSLPTGALQVVQVSDSHIYADPAGRLAGLVTQDTFDAVLRLAASKLPNADLILATGDLVHDASEQGYRRVKERLEQPGLPVYCLPGNHDIPQVMNRCLNSGGLVGAPKYVIHENWLLVLLDSVIPGMESGHLNQNELDCLDDALDRHQDLHALICLHHHPVKIDSAWMDGMRLDNPSEFFRIVDRYPGVQGILWGHIHQEFEAERNDVRLLGAPSTCIQFAPGQDNFGIDQSPPGLRWLELMPDGTIRSGVERLSSISDELDLCSQGY